MRPPIFVVVEDSYVDTYDSVDRAEASMEGYDVRDGSYEVFDADGTRLEVKAVAISAPVSIVEVPGRLPEPHLLQGWLRKDLQHTRRVRPGLVDMSEDALTQAELPDLVNEMQVRDKRSRER